jgi:hypothetical protein
MAAGDDATGMRANLGAILILCVKCRILTCSIVHPVHLQRCGDRKSCCLAQNLRPSRMELRLST